MELGRWEEDVSRTIGKIRGFLTGRICSVRDACVERDWGELEDEWVEGSKREAKRGLVIDR